MIQVYVHWLNPTATVVGLRVLHRMAFKKAGRTCQFHHVKKVRIHVSNKNNNNNNNNNNSNNNNNNNNNKNKNNNNNNNNSNNNNNKKNNKAWPKP